MNNLSYRLFIRSATGAMALSLLPALTGCHPAAQTATVTPIAAAKPNAQRQPKIAPFAATQTQDFSLPPDGVRGIYLTGWTAGSRNHFNNLVGLCDRTEINAMVIDVKDDGEVSYDANVPLVKETHASRKMFKVDKVLAVLKAHHIFPIARIACMRDSVLPHKHPELAVQSPSGGVWHDKTRHTWLNPYKKEVWDYNVDIALDAIKHGFKEIQFDYVRFPSEGKVSTLVYPGKPAGGLREDQIAAFMKYARAKIKATGAWFSADVFGLTSLVRNDEGIGQKFEKVIANLDYLCPMTYPSHYAYGEYGMKDPNKEPYKTIILSVGDAQKRMAKVKTCKLRPWLQDFSLRGVHYGPAQVKAQIKALNDLHINEYLLWNAGNRFTESALRKDGAPVVADTKAAEAVANAAHKSRLSAASQPAKTLR